jgi:hypothetical protein|tara:strand:- start:5205 stop:5453 length:249 start_codon:yes stop_codon:yes gene_type:complete
MDALMNELGRNVMSPEDVTSWERDQRLVLNELKRNTDLIESVRTDISGLKIELAMLKIKSGLWGIAAGSIPVIIALVLKSLD